MYFAGEMAKPTANGISGSRIAHKMNGWTISRRPSPRVRLSVCVYIWCVDFITALSPGYMKAK